MGVVFDCRWIDPADATIRAAVNQIDATVSSVTEHEDQRAGHVESHHRFADWEAFQGRYRLGNNDRVPRRCLLLLVRGPVTGGAGAPIAVRPRASRASACPATLTILAPTLVPPQPRFDAHGCLIGACISICRERLGFEHNARVEMNHALAAETEPLPADGGSPRKTALEILATASATRALTRSRSASPTAMFLPETRNGMIALR